MIIVTAKLPDRPIAQQFGVWWSFELIQCLKGALLDSQMGEPMGRVGVDRGATMNETQSTGNRVNTEVVEKKHTPGWRAMPAVLGVLVIVAAGVVIGLRPAHTGSTTVSVLLLGHHYVVARGGISATVASILLLLFAVFIPAWAIINAIRTPKSTFTSFGRSKGRWVVSMIILFFIGDASFLLVPIYYLLRVRPQLNREQAGARF